MSNDEIQTPERLKDDYTFIRLLGEGTSGKTWLAKRNSDEQLVAVKVMKFSLAENFKSYELFCREAQVMKSINIPGVPKFFECQAGDASSLSYIIQEYIEYPSLQAIISERGKLNEATVLKILENLAEIIYQLQTNYAPPVIHRDIKPSNVLCDLDGDKPKVTLIDFGAVANPQKRSEKSTVAGTFGYMAPEQMLNDVVIQSDYYALGALAVNLLTGIEPVEMETRGDAFALDYMGTIQAHAPQTSQAMLMLLGHLLEPIASKRPINAIALLEEIRRVRNGELPIPQTENEDDSAKSFGKRVLAWLKNHMPRPKIVIIDDSDYAEWPTTNGIIHSATELGINNHRVRAEYTFDANDRTWCGSWKTNKQFVTPCHCIVRYNPKDPRFNSLEKLSES
ncbi:MAG: serine/threonine protein kinase [Proteobacteria bacterium]|nr:serine/threonine protein kinase [Pseudomonadota bacterium]